MNPVDPWAALLPLAVAALTMRALRPWTRTPAGHERHVALDGLRGYLALFVFVHHACVWRGYLRTGEWVLPSSALLVHMAQASVAMFFMITGFLFASKILDGAVRPIDWGRLYVSRVLRLVPLYLFSVGAMLLAVAAASGWKANEPTARLLAEAAQWASFTALGNPDVNGLRSTWIVTAGVTWSLPYEWFFYLGLPLLALAFRVRVPHALAWAAGACIVAILTTRTPALVHACSFLPGIAAAMLARSPAFRRFAARPEASAIVVACAGVAVAAYPSTYSIVPWALFACAFILVACGNTLFGFLAWRLSRDLGSISYGVYLLHGIVLFAVFRFLVGFAPARELGALGHWTVVAFATPALVAICLAAFRLIELPAMDSTAAVLQRLRARTRWARRWHLGDPDLERMSE
jgi:peptidoglycan/LPS O-acetylase OafA/YrhL